MKSITVLCLMLMLVWASSGCADIAGFASQNKDLAGESEATETAEEPAPVAEQAENTEPVEDTKQEEDTGQAEASAPDEAMEISINDIGAVMIAQTVPMDSSQPRI